MALARQPARASGSSYLSCGWRFQTGASIASRGYHQVTMKPIRTDFTGYEGKYVAIDARTGEVVIA